MEMAGLYYTEDIRVIPLVGRYERDEDQAYLLSATHKHEVPTHIRTVKELFQMFQSEHGRCVSNVWWDIKDVATHVGWIFEKREEYVDEKGKYYICATWVALHRMCEHCADGFVPAKIEKKPYNPEAE